MNISPIYLDIIRNAVNKNRVAVDYRVIDWKDLLDFLGSVQSDSYLVYKHLADVNPQNEFILC